ncbi:ROK family protein [Phytohabitans sp. ZYX-F-186]|uniref:ROK family protein n=1 Tax=Phytohabitans maris TaxID=3071409 RepID=A0ABU0ZWI2_9ACTN|nr:ROK family protein [Phytohabitans sp. ZYX-F-186]MDQ7911400.1 ROK family protein [Phytohabitans sp. ZYX-F-186]
MTRLAGSSKLLRAINESATLALLLDRGTLTRGDLRELTGLSKPTTSEVMRRLTDAGLAVVVGHTSGGPGPSAEIYAANPAAGHAIAISVREAGRPHLSAVLCDLAGAEVARAEVAAAADPLPAVTGLVDDLSRRAGLAPGSTRLVQLALPGSYDPAAGVIRHIDVPGWDRPGLVADLAARLGATVAADNDVNLAAIAERHHGVAGAVESFALVWFSGGLGLAIDLGGTLLRGARGGAGEIGYVPVGLGRGADRTDLTDLVGGPAVLRLAGTHGIAAATPEAAVAAAVSSADAGPFLDALAERIAYGLAAVAAVLDPPLVVLAGDVGRAGGEALATRVTAALRATTPLDPAIAVTGVPGDPVLRGAQAAANHALRAQIIASSAPR